MSIDPQSLLSGPRGRRLCFEYLAACAREAGTPESEATANAMFWAAHQLEPNPGTVITFGAHDGSFVEPVVTPTDLAALWERAAVTAPTARSLHAALVAAVDRAAYWQAPDGSDALASSVELRPVLARVAELVVASPHSAWWSTPIALEDQWSVPWDGGGASSPERDTVLDRWRTATMEDVRRAELERPVDPAARWSAVRGGPRRRLPW